MSDYKKLSCEAGHFKEVDSESIQAAAEQWHTIKFIKILVAFKLIAQWWG